MKFLFLRLITFAVLFTGVMACRAADYPLQPVPFNEVEMTSDFWRPRLVTQRTTLVPFAFEKTQVGVEHLKAARDFLAGKKVDGHRASRFIDSDLYKVMEGAAYLLQLRRDPELEARLDQLADLIAGAQQPSGYLYPSHTTGVGKAKNMMGDAPYTFIVHSHELYNVGHLYEAAVAYYQATGKDKLLKVAEKSAQHINNVIFVGDPNYHDGKPILQAPGHQEILHQDAKYLDVAEVALLNNVLAAVNFEGNRFCYVNPLEADGKYPFNHGTAGRAPWFGTACCPSNLARLIPQVPGMTYAHDDNDLYITFFAESRTQVEIRGVKVTLEQKTAYPNDGEIGIAISPEKPTRFRLRLRIPTWTQNRFVPGELYRYADSFAEPVRLSVNGNEVATTTERGFASIDREWIAGDRVVLDLPMPVRVNECHEAVMANQNRIALTRGPFVLCAEGVDNGGATQRFFFDDLPDTSNSAARTTAIDSGSFIQVDVPARAVRKDGTTESTNVVLTPYYAWNNRGAGSMSVWFPRDKAFAVFDPHLLPKESIFAEITASHTSPLDTVSAIGDGKEPRFSSGKKVPRWTSRPQKGKPQWIQARFHEAKSVRSIGVYWMQDREDVRFPKQWSLEVKQDGKWKSFQLYTTDRYETRANRYNVVHPAAPLTCDAIRIGVIPTEDACVGILEVQVAFEK